MARKLNIVLEGETVIHAGFDSDVAGAVFDENNEPGVHYSLYKRLNYTRKKRIPTAEETAGREAIRQAAAEAKAKRYEAEANAMEAAAKAAIRQAKKMRGEPIDDEPELVIAPAPVVETPAVESAEVEANEVEPAPESPSRTTRRRGRPHRS